MQQYIYREHLLPILIPVCPQLYPLTSWKAVFLPGPFNPISIDSNYLKTWGPHKYGHEELNVMPIFSLLPPLVVFLIHLFILSVLIVNSDFFLLVMKRLNVFFTIASSYG